MPRGQVTPPNPLFKKSWDQDRKSGACGLGPAVAATLLLLVSRFGCVDSVYNPAPPGSPALGFSVQELKWVAVSFSDA